MTPLTVPVLPARVELGKSSDTPTPGPVSRSVRITARALWKEPQLKFADLGLNPTMSFLAGLVSQVSSLNFLSCEMDTEAATFPGSWKG